MLAALDNALEIAKPSIVNSDQGSQYTSELYVKQVLASQSKISMDGWGRYMDNIFTERLWRTVKYQEVYLHDYESSRKARNSIGRFFEKYNTYRPHQALRNLTPVDVYFGNYTIG